MRRQRFIAYMLIYGHEEGGLKRAYEEAGYKKGVHTQQLAQKLLKAPEVQAALQAAVGARVDRLEIKADRILQELALLAFSDITHYEMNKDGVLEIGEQYSPSVSRAVQSVEYSETVQRDRTVTRRMKVKLWDKTTALTNLMKYMGMLVDRSVNLNLNGKLPLEVAREAIEKARAANVLPLQYATEEQRLGADYYLQREVARHGEVEELQDSIGEPDTGPKQPPPLPINWMELEDDE